MNLCIVKSLEIGATETFIRAHIERLPARISVIEGDPPCQAGRPLISQGLIGRAIREGCRRLGLRSYQSERTAAYVRGFRRFQTDIVLAEYGVTGVRVLQACIALRVPLAVHFHGYDASVGSLLSAYGAGYRSMFGYASAIFAVSSAMRARLLELGAPPERTHLNPYGVDVDEQPPGDCEHAPPVFMAVGRFVEKKAPFLTLLAFSRVLQTCPDARLRMFGDGILLDACRDLVVGLGVAEAVTFAGQADHATILKEMRVARCFVQHSVTAPNGDSEGTPVAILEAGAAGLPVVATRHGGIPEAVIHGETGLLVAERDVDGMAAHMIKMAQNPPLAGEMGRAGRAHIETCFSMQRHISTLDEVLRA